MHVKHWMGDKTWGVTWEPTRRKKTSLLLFLILNMSFSLSHFNVPSPATTRSYRTYTWLAVVSMDAQSAWMKSVLTSEIIVNIWTNNILCELYLQDNLSQRIWLSEISKPATACNCSLFRSWFPFPAHSYEGKTMKSWPAVATRLLCHRKLCMMFLQRQLMRKSTES